MKKIVLFLVTLCTIVVSCDKQVKQPLNYSVTNDALQNGVFDVYIPDNGTYDMAVLVKFLSGYISDQVTLKLTGLPSTISVTPDSAVTFTPTFTQHYIFTITNAAIGKTQLTLTASSPGLANKVYNFNIIVIPANCATIFAGTLNGSNACTTNYTYSATGSVSDTSEVLYINNFGGYGPESNAKIILDCINNTVTIPQQTVGNGTSLQGSGTFTANSMTVNYSAVTTPGGPADNCTATFTTTH